MRVTSFEYLRNWLILVFLGTSLLSANRSLAQTTPPKRCPAAAISIIDGLPKSALAQPSFELMPRELIKVFGEKELGIDLLEIKRTSFVVGLPGDPQLREPPDFGLIVEFDSPQSLSDQFLKEFEKMDTDQPTTYQMDPSGTMLVELDEKTLVIGKGVVLAEILGGATDDGPLMQRLQSMPQDDHLKMVVLIEPIRDLIKQNLPPKNQVPPPFGEFLVLPDLIRSISYHANFSNNEISELMIEANDERDAKKIMRLIENTIEMAKGAALSGIASQMGISADYEPAAVAYADRVAEFLKTNMKPQIDGSTLVYDLRGLQQGNGASSTATIGILVGMLLPAVQATREAARRSASMNQLKQFGLSVHNYATVHGKFPMQANYDDDGKPLLSWRVHVLPFLEQQPLYEQFHLDEPWDSEHNIQLLEKMPEIYANPNTPIQIGEMGLTVYQGVSGPGTVFPGNQEIGFADITDGTSNTALFVEVDPDMAVEWTKPEDWELNPNDSMQGLGGLRPGGFNVVFCDGSVRFISKDFDSETWKLMTQISDGQTIE